MVKHNQHFRATLVAVALLLGLGSSAWTGDMVPAGAPQMLTTVLHEDFEDDAVGALGAPWTISSSGTGSVSIVNTTDHGHVLGLQGSSTEGHFLIASRPAYLFVLDGHHRPGGYQAWLWRLVHLDLERSRNIDW